MEDSWCLSLGDICKVFNGGSDSRRLDVLRWELEISREFNFMFYVSVAQGLPRRVCF